MNIVSLFDNEVACWVKLSAGGSVIGIRFANRIKVFGFDCRRSCHHIVENRDFERITFYGNVRATSLLCGVAGLRKTTRSP